MFLKWLGTRTFIANTTASGVALGYFSITANPPMVILIALLWIFSAVTWTEYKNALAG